MEGAKKIRETGPSGATGGAVMAERAGAGEAPRVPPHALQRPALQNTLEKCLFGPHPCRCLAIVAPVGYGKSTLTAQWVAAAPRGRAVAWATLDARDDEPASLAAHLAQALRAAGVVGAPGPDPVGWLPTALRDAGGPAVLVVDGYEVLRDPACHALVSRMVGALPPAVRMLVLGSCTPLFCADYALSGACEVVEAGELAFDGAQADRLARQVGAATGGTGYARAKELAAGWPAALWLAFSTAARTGAAPDTVLERETAEGGALDALFQRLLDAEQPACRSLLLHAGLFGTFCAGLLAAAEGSRMAVRTAASLVAHVRSRALFVTDAKPPEAQVATAAGAQGAAGGWYGLHPLFRSWLRARAFEELGTAGVAEAFRGAAGWFGSHGMLEQMMRCAQATGDAAFMAERLNAAAEQLLPVIPNTGGFDLRRWRDLVPDSRLRTYPAVHVADALERMTAGPGDFVDPGLADGFEEGCPSPRTRGLLALLRVSGIVAAGDPCDEASMRALVEDAARCLSEDDPLSGYVAFDRYACAALFGDRAQVERSLALLRRASVVFGLGKLERVALDGERQLAWLGGSPLEASWADVGLPEGEPGPEATVGHCRALLDRGRVAEAAAGLDAALGEACSRGDAAAEVACRRSLAEAALMGGDVAGLREQAARLAARRGCAPLAAVLEAHAALLAGDDGSAAAVARGLDEARAALARPWSPLWLTGLATEEALRSVALAGLPLLARAGDPAEALDALAAAEGRCRKLGLARCLTAVDVFAAVALARAGDAPAGVVRLERALMLSRATGSAGPFLLAGAAWERCLPDGWAEGPAAGAGLSSEAFQQARLVRGAARQARVRGAGPDALSDRERAVLAMVASGMSNAQVAEALSLKLPTVKSHLYRIYAKLGVANRTEAALLARQAGLGV